LQGYSADTRGKDKDRLEVEAGTDLKDIQLDSILCFVDDLVDNSGKHCLTAVDCNHLIPMVRDPNYG